MAILDAGKRRGRLSRLSLGVIVAGVAVLVLPLAATQAIGGGTGSISGIVRDPSGAPVKNARINVTAPAVGGSATVATDAAGHWQLAQLPAGAFTVEVLAPGFRRLKETVTVENARETTRNVTLMLGSVREEITITTGNAPKPPAPPPAPDAAAPRTPPAPPAVPAPPAAPAPPGAVTPVQLIKQVTPAYPESAKAEKAAGQVVLRGVISVDGNVIGLTTISSDRPDLEEAARTAVQQWKYAPAKLNGVPVEVVTDITIKFRPE